MVLVTYVMFVVNVYDQRDLKRMCEKLIRCKSLEEF